MVVSVPALLVSIGGIPITWDPSNLRTLKSDAAHLQEASAIQQQTMGSMGSNPRDSASPLTAGLPSPPAPIV